MKLIDTSKSILENLYFISGPLLALLGFFIFKQINIAKKSLEIAKDQLVEAQKQLLISSKRDSIKLASEQIKYFSTDLIDLSNILYAELTKANINELVIPTKTFEFDIAIKHFGSKKINEYLEIIQPYALSYLNLLNGLETFATYFTQEVADEAVAFDAVGATFCYIVSKSSFQLCLLSKNKHESFFQNLIRLNKLWSERLEIKGLNLQKENLEKTTKEALEKLETDLKTKKDDTIKPLGT